MTLEKEKRNFQSNFVSMSTVNENYGKSQHLKGYIKEGKGDFVSTFRVNIVPIYSSYGIDTVTVDTGFYPSLFKLLSLWI